jgi:hypothetical protein
MSPVSLPLWVQTAEHRNGSAPQRGRPEPTPVCPVWNSAMPPDSAIAS